MTHSRQKYEGKICFLGPSAFSLPTQQSYAFSVILSSPAQMV